MAWFDYVFLIVIALSFLKGLKNGFFSEVGGLLGFVAGIYCSFIFNEEVKSLLLSLFPSISQPWISIISFVLPFLAVYFIFSIIEKLFTGFFESISMGWLNNFFGGLFGLIKAVLILSIILNLYEFVDSDRSLIGSDKVITSPIYKPILKVLPTVAPMFKDLVPEKEEIKEKVNKINKVTV